MDLRAYYRKINLVEASLVDADAVVVSYETPDGGKPGVASQVSKRVAAKLVVEGRARLATPEESDEYRKVVQEMSKKAQELALASKVQVAVVSDADLRAFRSSKLQK